MSIKCKMSFQKDPGISNGKQDRPRSASTSGLTERTVLKTARPILVCAPSVGDLCKKEVKNILNKERALKCVAEPIRITSKGCKKPIKSAGPVVSTNPKFNFDSDETSRQTVRVYADKSSLRPSYSNKPRSTSTSGLTERTVLKNARPILVCAPSVGDLCKKEGQNILEKEKALKFVAEPIRIISKGCKKPIKSAGPVISTNPRFNFDTDEASRQTVRVYADKSSLKQSDSGKTRSMESPRFFHSTLKFESDNKENYNNHSTQLCTSTKFKEISLVNKKNINQCTSVRPSSCSSLASISPSKTYLHRNLKNIFSPIKPNPFTNSNVLISKRPDRIRKPKVKRNAILESEKYVGDLYNEELLSDIIRCIKYSDRKIVLKPNFLEDHNNNESFRRGAVNWLIQLQCEIKFSGPELYLAVSLMDQILAKTHVATNMYQLLVLGTLWIASKTFGSRDYTASELVYQCNGAYLTRQLVLMERKVLKMMNYSIYTIEPSTCLNYYLKTLDIHHIKLAAASGYYILDCFSLCPEFSVYPSSILSAAAVAITVQIYLNPESERVNLFFRKHMSVEDNDTRIYVQSLMYTQMTNVCDKHYRFKGPENKEYV